MRVYWGKKSLKLIPLGLGYIILAPLVIRCEHLGRFLIGLES